MLADLDLPTTLTARAGNFTVRRGTPGDLPALMSLLADDPISAARGDRADAADAATYETALRSVLDAPLNDLLVVDDADGALVGTLQLTVIPGMARLLHAAGLRRLAHRLQVHRRELTPLNR